MERVVLLIDFEKVVIVIGAIDLGGFRTIARPVALRMRYHFILLYNFSNE